MIPENTGELLVDYVATLTLHISDNPVRSPFCEDSKEATCGTHTLIACERGEDGVGLGYISF